MIGLLGILGTAISSLYSYTRDIYSLSLDLDTHKHPLWKIKNHIAVLIIYETHLFLLC